MSESTPPPFPGETIRPRPRFQFSTATLLGTMALVAVVCCLAMVLPWIFAVAAALVAGVLTIAFAAFCIAGVVTAKGDRRLFAIAVLACFVISFWAHSTDWVVVQLLDDRGFSSRFATLIWAVISPLEHAALALLGGWIALRSQQFWKQETPYLGDSNASPTPGNNTV